MVLSRDPVQGQLLRLTLILFVSYLCVALALPVVPVFVSDQLGMGNVAAGLGVGIGFLATIATRGQAGAIADRQGAKRAVARGLACYVAGMAISALAGWLVAAPGLAYAVLLAGRLALGLGESLVGVGITSWGIGLAGQARAGRVLAMVGAAMYGGFAVGGPLGLAMMGWFGFGGAMAVGALLPASGWLAIRGIPAVPALAGARPSLMRVVGRIWAHGSIVCLQGIGFALIGAFFTLMFLDRGWSHAGLGLTAFGGGFVLMRLLFGHLPDKVGGLPVAIGSLAIEAVGQALIWQAGGPALAIAGAFLSGLGCSMVFPAMGREVVKLVEPQLRGTALGGFAAFQDLAYGLTGPLAGFVADRAGYGGVFLIGAGAAVLGLGMAVVLRAAGAKQPAV